jgi:hypothetical protein
MLTTQIDITPAAPKTGGLVMTHACAAQDPEGHESLSRACIASRIAALKGCRFAGEYDRHASQGEHLYVVPSDTLLEANARQLGVTCNDDLFGGVVPYSFLATKAITHGLPAQDAAMPDGWMPGLAERLKEHVLPGYTAFSIGDARRAAQALFGQGRIRLKKTSGIGGLGQWIAADMKELDALLDAIDPAEVQRDGIVLEINLTGVVTHSVGQVDIDGLRASYCGTQHTTRNHAGQEVYGGSRLLIVRGDFETLLQLPLAGEVRTAIRQARSYHAAVCALYPGFFASRANYDVAQGVDQQGRWRSGVLEQSWRLGGASPAEIAGLETFKGDPSITVVRASTTEIYGKHVDIPADAVLHYQGEDRRVGALTKYSRIESNANT